MVNVTKRYLITAATHNLGRVMQVLFGMGKPRGLQGGWGLLPRLENGFLTMLWLLLKIGMDPRPSVAPAIRNAR